MGIIESNGRRCPCCPRRWWGRTPCPSGSSASRPTTTSAGSARPTWPRSTRSRSRPRSRTRSTPGIDIVSDGELRRDNDIDYFLARIPGVIIERGPRRDYYDYYEAAVAAELPDDDKASLGLADDYAFTRGRPTGRSSSRSPARSRCRGGFRDSAYRGPGRPGPGARAAAQPGGQVAGGRRAPGSCRSTSRSWPATRSRPSSRWRRSTSSPTACRRPGRCTSATATGTPGPPGRATTTFCSRRCWRRRVDQLVLEFARKGLERPAPVKESAGHSSSAWA